MKRKGNAFQRQGAGPAAKHHASEGSVKAPKRRSSSDGDIAERQAREKQMWYRGPAPYVDHNKDSFGIEQKNRKKKRRRREEGK